MVFNKVDLNPESRDTNRKHNRILEKKEMITILQDQNNIVNLYNEEITDLSNSVKREA